MGTLDQQIAHLSTGSLATWPVEQFDAQVKEIALLLRDRLLHAVKFLTRPENHLEHLFCWSLGFDGDLGTENEGIWGRRWDGHGFGALPLYRGFKPTEPQYTGAIAYFLTPAEVGDVAYTRAKAFITAICRAARQEVPDFAHMADDFNVIAEEPVKDGRIDISIDWPINATDRVYVIIEAKFDHTVTVGQLKKYKKHFGSKTGEQHFFVVSLKETKLNFRDREDGWKAIRWGTLLRHLENEISKSPFADDDEDFRRLRSSLWQKIW